MTLSQRLTPHRLLPSVFSVAALACLALTGCGSGTFATDKPVSVTNAGGAQGIFMGGQQPVGNINIQMYQAGTSGYGSAATPLFTANSVKTTAYGNFNIPSFSCTSGTQLYLVGTGGQPIAANGNTPAVTNNNLALMTALGLCDNFNPGNFINVNELTTVSAVYALSPFMTGISKIGTTSSNTVGINNAAALVNSLVNTTNGTISGPSLPANATLPISLINTLADIMEVCVNSGGGSASDTTDGVSNGTACGKLFYLAPNSSGTAPTDTITAMLNIAQHPTVNVAKLNMLRSASPVFTPVLSVNSPPAAWSIGISYSGGGLSKPSAVAVDSSGNVWVANKTGNTVSKFNALGAVQSGASGYSVGASSAPAGIAIDASGSAWSTNSGNNTVSKITSSGTVTTYSGNGLATPTGVAIDSNNQVWVTNTGSGAGVSAFTNSGAAVSGSPFTGGGLTTPASVATSAK